MKNLVKTVLGIALLSFISCDKMKTLNEPEFEKDILGDLLKNIYKPYSSQNKKLLEKKDDNTVILKSSIIFYSNKDNYDKHAEKFEYKIDRISPNKDTLYLKNEKTSLKIYYNGKKDEVIYEGQKEKSQPYLFYETQEELFNPSQEEKEF